MLEWRRHTLRAKTKDTFLCMTATGMKLNGPSLASFELCCGIMVSLYYDPANIAPAALQKAFRGHPPCGSQPLLRHWIAQRWVQGGTSGGFQWLESSEPTPSSPWPSSVLPDFLLHWFQPSTANLMPLHCLLQMHRTGLQPSATRWLYEAGQLCAKSSHFHQRSTWGPLDVFRWPPPPPPCCLLLLGGQP